MRIWIIIIFAVNILSAVDDSLLLPIDSLEIEKALDSLANQGFFDYEMSNKEDSLLIVYDAEKTKFGNISYIVESKDTSLDIDSPVFLTSENLYDWILKIAREFADNGYPFAKIKINKLEISQNKADIALQINRNNRIKIHDVHIYENTKTKSSSIRKQMLLEKGQLYRISEIEKGISRVNRKGIVKFSKTHNIARDNQGNWYIGLNGEDIAQSSAQGLITAHRNAEDIMEFGGQIQANIKNIWGKARVFHLEWEKLNSENALLEFKAYDPNFAGTFFGAELYFGQNTKSTFLKRTLKINAEYPIGYIWDISAGFDFKWTIPDSSGLWRHRIPYQNSSGFVLGSRASTIDNPDFPKRGFYSDVELIGSINTFDAPKDAIAEENMKDQYELRTNISGSYVQYLDFWGPFIRFGAKGILTTTAKELSISQKEYIGGFNTIRGHLEDEAYGDRIFYSGAELRFLLAPKSAIFPFFDFGIYNENVISNIYGYGIGIISQTAIGMISISYGISPERNMTNGLLHFGIRSQF
ncbi:MAG: BamA/TamA family outer membrane protein [Candidatus Zixiibacteriota bacterium]